MGRTLTNFLSVRGGLSTRECDHRQRSSKYIDSIERLLGNSNLFSFDVGLVYDTRQSPFLVGLRILSVAATYRQAFGDLILVEVKLSTERNG